MIKSILLLPLLLLCSLRSAAQALPDSSALVNINQQIDTYVVQQNITALDSFYANDFVFSHGSGNVQGKAAWLKTVARTTYPLRQHDSVTIELHGDIGIVKGKMLIHRVDKDKTDRYKLRYIRVYVLRNKRWQLVSHSTTFEQHERGE